MRSIIVIAPFILLSGICFVVDDSKKVSGNDDAGVALVRAFNYARDTLDNNEAVFSFLASVSITDRVYTIFESLGGLAYVCYSELSKKVR